jgi:hypothetical protein
MSVNIIKRSAYRGLLVKYQTIQARTAKTSANLSDFVIPSKPYLNDSKNIIPQNTVDIQKYTDQ